ncbi:hypothetical protein I8J29_12350 [Paenibacillus sp. MWE-103]|uniref:Sporulation lipoprotein YhcN/YlaJ n=1 Tax=Paenibacillus artemisiicola TaxID=1172618 RepID=A0ABS3W9I3_9BACL|nr:hypothetical protein [Paenibacillus artemisiicola]MBO7744991.1 hypothetical protein [Paenibacillus artemisiicola]
MSWYMNKSMGRIAGACGLALALSGCAHDANRSPKELLSLSVSGLSGVDRYAFSGDTAIGAASGTASRPAAFRGTVQHHDQVSVQTEGGADEMPAGVHPLRLLNDVERMAARAEVVPEASNGQRTVLRITADPAKAAKVWTNRLRSEFALLKNKVPANGSAASARDAGTRSQEKPSALREAWDRELDRSGKEFEAMLSTMSVRSTSTLVIDRKKLLPLSLEERTEFRYEANGKPARESRTTRIAFKRS